MTKVSFMANGKRVSFTTKSKKSSKSRKKKGSRKTKRARSRKSNKQRRSTHRSMPRKRKSSRRRSPGKKSFIDRIPILNNKTVQKVGFGLGMGVIVADIIGLAARFGPPQISNPLVKNANLIKLGVELATEPLSAVVDVALNPKQLSRITGGLRNGNGMGTQAINGNQAGFA